MSQKTKVGESDASATLATPRVADDESSETREVSHAPDGERRESTTNGASETDETVLVEGAVSADGNGNQTSNTAIGSSGSGLVGVNGMDAYARSFGGDQTTTTGSYGTAVGSSVITTGADSRVIGNPQNTIIGYGGITTGAYNRTIGIGSYAAPALAQSNRRDEQLAELSEKLDMILVRLSELDEKVDDLVQEVRAVPGGSDFLEAQARWDAQVEGASIASEVETDDSAPVTNTSSDEEVPCSDD